MKRDDDIEFKAKVAACAIDEHCGIESASERFGVSPHRVYEWAKVLLVSMAKTFVDDDTPADEQDELDDNTRSALVRLASEYGRITRGDS